MTTMQNDIQLLIECINGLSNNYGIAINLRETKYMVIEKDVNNAQDTLIINKRIK